MPTRSQTRIDRMLTNMSVAYVQDASVYIADKVFPVVPVTEQSARYFVYKREDWFRDEAAERAPGTESEGGDYEIDNTPTYFAKQYSYHKDVTEQDRVNSQTPLDADRDATDFVTNKMLLRREMAWASKYFVPGVWATEYTGAAATNTGTGAVKFWSDPTSNPIIDITNAKLAQQRITGHVPNVLTLGAETFAALSNHPMLLERIKYTQRGIVTEELIAALFGVTKVVVANAIKNTAPKGKDAVMEFIHGKHALLSYAPPRPALKTPSAGYIFAWTGLLGAGAYGGRIVRIPMDWRGIGTERIEGDIAFDQKIVADDMGTFFANVVE